MLFGSIVDPGYKIVLFLHILAVVLAFGPTFGTPQTARRCSAAKRCSMPFARELRCLACRRESMPSRCRTTFAK